MTEALLAQRVPPFDQEAERAVLASVLQSYERAYDACVNADVSSESFYIPRHRMIWDVFTHLISAGRPIDYRIVCSTLKDRGELEACGEEAYLLGMIDSTPTAANVEHYAAMMVDKHVRRRVIDAARKAERDAFVDVDVSAEDVRSRAEFSIAEIRSERRQQRQPSEVLKAGMERYEMACQRGCAGLRTGYSIIDTFCGGLLPQSVNYISGKGAAGKTTLARNIAENVAGAGDFVGIFSMEQSEEIMWMSIAATRAKLSMFRVNQGRLPPKDEHNLIAAAQAVAKLPIAIDDMPQTIPSIRSRVRQWISKRNCKLVVIDYVQAIREHMRFKTAEERLTTISAELRDLAKETGVPLLILSALSNEGLLRGSGMLGYDAWTHIMLEKKGDADKDGVTVVECSFEKGRFSPSARPESIYLYGNEGRFYNVMSSSEFSPEEDES